MANGVISLLSNKNSAMSYCKKRQAVYSSIINPLTTAKVNPLSTAREITYGVSLAQRGSSPCGAGRPLGSWGFGQDYAWPPGGVGRGAVLGAAWSCSL